MPGLNGDVEKNGHGNFFCQIWVQGTIDKDIFFVGQCIIHYATRKKKLMSVRSSYLISSYGMSISYVIFLQVRGNYHLFSLDSGEKFDIFHTAVEIKAFLKISKLIEYRTDIFLNGSL